MLQRHRLDLRSAQPTWHLRPLVRGSEILQSISNRVEFGEGAVNIELRAVTSVTASRSRCDVLSAPAAANLVRVSDEARRSLTPAAPSEATARRSPPRSHALA